MIITCVKQCSFCSLAQVNVCALLVYCVDLQQNHIIRYCGFCVGMLHPSGPSSLTLLCGASGIMPCHLCFICCRASSILALHSVACICLRYEGVLGYRHDICNVFCRYWSTMCI